MEAGDDRPEQKKSKSVGQGKGGSLQQNLVKYKKVGERKKKPTAQIAKNRNSRIAVIVNDMSASGSGIGRHHISARPIIK